MATLVKIDSSGPYPLSAGVRAGDFIFVSGQVPTDADGRVVSGGIAVETAIVLDKVCNVLEKAGSSLADVAKVTVYLTDMKNFKAMNEVYQKYFPTEPPARACLQVQLAIEAGVEIEAVAYSPEK